MSGPAAPYGPEEQGRPPGVEPQHQPAWDDATGPPPTPARPRLDVGRYWAGAAATVLVCALLGFAASVIINDVFDLELASPPDLIGTSPDTSWAVAGGLFALIASIVLQLLIVAAPQPRVFFGWLVALTTVVLAVLPFTGRPELVSGLVTALVWVILGMAVWSMLTGVLSRTLRP